MTPFRRITGALPLLSSGLAKIGETFGDRDPATITASEIAEWIAELAKTRKPGTLNQYLIVFRLLLDQADVDSNPARDPRVKTPKQGREEPSSPSGEHVPAILAEIHDPLRRLLFMTIHDPLRRLLFMTIEQGAMRLGESVNLRWGDVDRIGLRLRLPRSATKRGKAAGSTCPSG